MYLRILELASQNNVLLLERLKEQGEEAVRRAREAEDQVCSACSCSCSCSCSFQVKRLQNLLTSKDDQLKKLTNRLDAGSDLEDKVKKFFGENEDFHKKKVAELAKANSELASKLEESEKRR